MIKRDGPTHPPGVWKVYRYVKEWYGLHTRGCTKIELCWKVSNEFVQAMPNPLCNNIFFKGLRIARHNAIAQQLTNLLKSYVYSRHLTLINTVTNMATTKTNHPAMDTKLHTQHHTMWMPHKTKIGQRLHTRRCIWKKKSTTTPVLTIQIIEFTFTHDRFLDQAIQIKEDKYNPLVGAIRAHGWNSRLRTVITVGLRGALHKRSIEHLKNLHIQTSFFFENSMTYIYQIAIKHLTYLVVNKNKYPPPQPPTQ